MKLRTVIPCLLLAGCNAMTTPEQIFDRAVLNTNLIAPLCGTDISAFRHGTATMVDGKVVIKPRRDMLSENIRSIEENLAKVDALPDSGETSELKATSIELHKLVLSAYQDAYGPLADLYDRGADASEIAAAVGAAHEPYCARYEQLSGRLVELGKPYAEKHGIKVRWGDR